MAKVREATPKNGRVLFSIHLPEAEYDKLVELAELEDQSKREIVRKALKVYYRKVTK